MTDDSQPLYSSRRERREAEKTQHISSRRELRDAVEADVQARDRQRERSGGLRPPNTARSAEPTPAGSLSETAPSFPPGTPVVIRPSTHTTTIPVASVVDYDSSLDIDSLPRTPSVAASSRPHQPRPQTSPASPGPSVAKTRPVEQKTMGQRAMTWAVMAAAPLLFIGVSMPVNLFYTADAVTPAIASETDDDYVDTAGQAFVVRGGDSDIVAISRESWSVTSYAEVLRSRYGSRSYTYSVTNGGAIRWPFPVAVPISAGFGNRVSPCRYCSSYHRGVDFLPGRGAPTYAMADGVVLQSEFSGGYGQHVYLQHRLNGQSVVTVYAHLERDSSPLQPGDEVKAGEFVGLVGSTGASTGPHLHFEVRIDGVYVDPFAYLTANAG